MAVLFLGYALGKAVRAVQGRLGFPGGPDPSAGDYERYSQVVDVATAQGRRWPLDSSPSRWSWQR